LMMALEEALDDMDNHMSKQQPPNRNQKKPTSTMTNRMIRRITVVTGRGFYTYCDGPVAPFLKIEYYRPENRWKVKKILEQGLEELPSSCFPILTTNDATNKNEAPDVKATMPILQFHCFEAHIPYTMQFFKDYNLAGAAYIHLNDTVQFRSRQQPRPLQPAQPPRPRPNQPPDNDNGIMNSGGDPKTTDSSSSLVSPLPKQTSCPVEVDATVDSILNVLDIMTTGTQQDDIDDNNMDNDDDEGRPVHWRAVPSLKEIWSQERRRMKKLLGSDATLWPVVAKRMEKTSSPQQQPEANPHTPSPSTNTTTINSSPTTTTTTTANTWSAVQGVRRLVHVTEGLQENLDRAVRDIVDRHAVDINRQDALVSSRAVVGGMRRSRGAIAAIRPGSSEPPKGGHTKTALTPVDDDAMHMLEGLGNLFEKSGDDDDNDMDDVEIGGDDDDHDDSGGINQAGTTYTPALSLSQAFHSSAHKRHSTTSVAFDEFALSQKMDRGEAIVEDNPFESLDDAINPVTLLPYAREEEENSDDDEEEDEHALEKQLATLATQIYDNDHDDDEANDADANEYHKHEDSQPTHRDSDSFDLPGVANVNRHSSPAKQLNATSPAAKNQPRQESALSMDTESTPNWTHAPGVVIQPTKSVPVSSELRQVDLQLHPMPSYVPRWTPFIAKYSSDNSNPRRPLLGVSPTGIVLPTRSPPMKAALIRWCDARKRRELGSSTLAKQKSNIGTKRRRQPVVSDWPIANAVDSVADAKGKAKDHPHHPSQPKKPASTTTRVSIEYSERPLQGICNQGGRIQVENGGQLKARTKATQLNSQEKRDMKRGRSDHLPCPVKMMSMEIHVQRRVRRTGIDDTSMIALTPDWEKDSVSAIVLVLATDPGGGESLVFMERYVLFVPIEKTQTVTFSRTLAEREAHLLKRNLPLRTLGVDAPVHVECLADERQLLLRFASLVRWKDPDLLMSWDTQGAGLGYAMERGLALTAVQDQRAHAQGIEMARLLSRTSAPQSSQAVHGRRLSSETEDHQSDLFRSAFPGADHGAGSTAPRNGKSPWKGSGLGGEWDDNVGAGQAASSIVRNCCVVTFESS
jgi:hypothetical protein